MNSYISHFKPWFLALAIIALIEGAYFAYAHPPLMDRTNLLQYGFAKPELPQRLFTWHKLRDLADGNWTVAQVGDSSGFHGIDPRIVETFLPDGQTYVNMSCCANQGFMGYYNVLKYTLEQSPSIKYAVLHFTPYTMPNQAVWKDDGAALWGDSNITVFGEAIGKEVNQPFTWAKLPTLALRQPLTQEIFYLGEKFRRRDQPLLDNVNYLSFLESYKTTHGWMPASDPPTLVAQTECVMPTHPSQRWIPPYYDTLLEEVLATYASLARAHDAKLVVVFQPVACVLGTGAGSKDAREAVQRFAKSNPDVAIPFPLIETWPQDRFLVPAHVTNEAVPLTSSRLGNALAEIIRQR
jgi:hypothetical protein